jgi:hypothetical protein
MSKQIILKTNSKVPIMIAAVEHVNAKLSQALAVCREYDRLYDTQPTIRVLSIPKKYSQKQK